MKTYDEIIAWCKKRRLAAVDTSEGFVEARRRRAFGIPKAEPVHTRESILQWAREKAASRRERIAQEAAQ